MNRQAENGIAKPLANTLNRLRERRCKSDKPGPRPRHWTTTIAENKFDREPKAGA
jgi:hypothetical protein